MLTEHYFFWRRVRDSNPSKVLPLLVFKTSAVNRLANSPLFLVPREGIEPSTISRTGLNRMTSPTCRTGLLLVHPEGVEPSRSYEQKILSLLCLPFHHGCLWCPPQVSNLNLLSFNQALAPCKLRGHYLFLAEDVGFEPTDVLPPQISNLLHYHSANLPFLLICIVPHFNLCYQGV